MEYRLKSVGQSVAELRRRRRWTRAQLIAKLQILGCPITSATLAQIETRYCSVTPVQITFLTHALNVSLEELSPPKPDAD